MAYQSYSGGFSHQEMLPFLKVNIFYAFRARTQFQLSTVWIVYHWLQTSSPKDLRKRMTKTKRKSTLYIRKSSRAQWMHRKRPTWVMHRARDPMYKSKEWEIKGMIKRPLLLGRGEIWLENHQMPCQHSGETAMVQRKEMTSTRCFDSGWAHKQSQGLSTLDCFFIPSGLHEVPKNEQEEGLLDEALTTTST